MTGEFASTDGDEHVVEGLFTGQFEDRGFHLVQLKVEAAKLLLQNVTAASDVLRALTLAEPLTDLGAGVVGVQVAQGGGEPVAAWAPGGTAGDDLNDVAVVEGGGEVDEATVDLSADARVAEFSVDTKGEVQGSGARGHILEFATGRIDEDLVLENVSLEGFNELAGDRKFTLPVDQLLEPGEVFALARAGGGDAVLVPPVRCYSEFGFGIHVARPDLDLKRPRTGPIDSGVEGAVAAGFGVSDVVVELAGERPPEAMDDTESVVAVFRFVDDHTDGEQIVDLAEALADSSVLLDLLVGGVDVLHAAADFGVEVVVAQDSLQLALELG